MTKDDFLTGFVLTLLAACILAVGFAIGLGERSFLKR